MTLSESDSFYSATPTTADVVFRVGDKWTAFPESFLTQAEANRLTPERLRQTSPNTKYKRVTKCGHSLLVSSGSKNIYALGHTSRIGLRGALSLRVKPIQHLFYKSESDFIPISTTRPLVVKVLDNKEMFETEKVFLSRLGRLFDYVVRDMGAGKFKYYLIMPYIPGRDLDCVLFRVTRRGVLPRTRYTLNEQMRLMIACGRAVAEVHNAGILQRDVKLSNLRVTSLDEVTLLDGSIIQLVDEAGVETNTLPHEAGGTMTFMANELIQDMRDRQMLTLACDIYALGVVFAYILFGYRVHRRADDFYNSEIKRQCLLPGLLSDDNAAELRYRATQHAIRTLLAEKQCQTHSTPLHRLYGLIQRMISTSQDLRPTSHNTVRVLTQINKALLALKKSRPTDIESALTMPAKPISFRPIKTLPPIPETPRGPETYRVSSAGRERPGPL